MSHEPCSPGQSSCGVSRDGKEDNERGVKNEKDEAQGRLRGDMRGRREVGSGEVPRGEKMLQPGTDIELYITEYTLVYEENCACHGWNPTSP